MTAGLTRDFFSASAVEVAPHLLGAFLTHTTPDGAVTIRITEVEAYVGEGMDPGSHSFRGMTKRNASMFGEPGHLYVYFTYGMHTCANITCSPNGSSSAVLLRGGDVVDGIDLARMRRTTSRKDADLAQGPARLTVALGIALSDDGRDALAAPFRLEAPNVPSEFMAGPRTGVSGAGGSDEFPWRFWIPGDPTVSPYKRHPKSH